MELFLHEMLRAIDDLLFQIEDHWGNQKPSLFRTIPSFLAPTCEAVIRSQEMEFIRMSRRDSDGGNLVSTMYRQFQEEIIHRGEAPMFTVTSGAAYKPPGMGHSGHMGSTGNTPAPDSAGAK